MSAPRAALLPDDLRAALRVRELADPGRGSMSERMEEASVSVGVLRELELWTLYEIRAKLPAKEVSRARWEKLRALPEVADAHALALPVRSSWEALSVQGRAPGDPVAVPCGACGGRRPTRCLTCRGMGRVTCGCTRQARAMCVACRGTGRKACTPCGRSGFVGCAVCAGGGELYPVELFSAERGVEQLRTPVDPMPEGLALPDDDEVSEAWATEYEERAERLSAEAPSFDATKALSYRGSYARGLDARCEEALRFVLAGYTPRYAGAEVCAQRLLVRSLSYACARWPAHQYALWIVGDGRVVLEKGAAPRGRSGGRGLLTASAVASAGAALAWWFGGR